MEEEEILKRFIEFGVLRGTWFREVPIGLGVVVKTALQEKAKWQEYEIKKVINIYSVTEKRIDAVCVKGLKNELKPKIKSRYWMQIYKDPSLNPFKNKRVWLIEVKKDLMSDRAFTAIGQLLYYEHHFKRDWKGLVEGKAIIYGDGTDDITLEAIKGLKTRLGILAWHVSENGRITSI